MWILPGIERVPNTCRHGHPLVLPHRRVYRVSFLRHYVQFEVRWGDLLIWGQHPVPETYLCEPCLGGW